MIVIGLTGGIASGKSTAAEMLRELGAVVIDADRLGHRSYEPGTPGFEKVVNAFGHDIVGSDGLIDRRILGGKVFGAPGQMERLNSIVWPEIRNLIREEIVQIRAQDRNTVIVLEAAVLIEAEWQDLCDEIWVVTTPIPVAVERLRSRNNMAEDAAMARINAQMSNEDRLGYATVTIENAGSEAELRGRVERQWAALQQRLAPRTRKAASPRGAKKPAARATAARGTAATTRTRTAKSASTKSATAKSAGAAKPAGRAAARLATRTTAKSAPAKPASRASATAKPAARKATTTKATTTKAATTKAPAKRANATKPASAKASPTRAAAAKSAPKASASRAVATKSSAAKPAAKAASGRAGTKTTASRKTTVKAAPKQTRVATRATKTAPAKAASARKTVSRNGAAAPARAAARGTVRNTARTAAKPAARSSGRK